MCYIRYMCVFLCFFLKLNVPCFNSSFSVMFCFALTPFVCCDLSSSYKLCLLAALYTRFLVSGSWRSFGGTPFPDHLMCQNKTSQRVSSMGEAFSRLVLTIMFLFTTADCIASKKLLACKSRQHD